MKTKLPNSKRLDILGNSHASDQQIFSSTLKRWRNRLGYCSIFAAVPAVIASSLPAARSVDAKGPTAKVTEPGVRMRNKLNLTAEKRALLKRQSGFLLPHQKSSNNPLAPMGGLDDCPGRAIPGGNYTAASPFVDSGDTTGANDTISSLPSFYYYYWDYDAHGPDNVYSFTLSALGPDPQIEVSSTSGTYRPLIYVKVGPCPAGTGNYGDSWWGLNDSRWWAGNTVTLGIDYFPVNVPLYLFVDSALNDANGSGSYTIKMKDVTIAPGPSLHPLDGAEFFVRQHYRDFLNREPDAAGLAFWMNEITSCGSNVQCIEEKRINDSGSFFLSIEFQVTGYLVHKLYKAAYGDIPGTPVPTTFNEFVPDTQAIGKDVIVNQPGWQSLLENNKQAFLLGFVQRSRFLAAYPPAMSSQEFVDKLDNNAGNPLSVVEREQLASDLLAGRRSRADVLRAIAENETLSRREFNRAFVLMQYFGYLRRNPNDAPDGNFVGYNFWLEKLDRFNGDFIQAEMVKAFVTSLEYRQRFAP